jgi:hypothetical protein
MNERGAALIEALIVTATAGLIWASAARVLADLPSQSAKWEAASAARQSVRVIESRLSRVIARMAPIEVTIDGSAVRVPAMWPRRVGLFRPDAEGDVSPEAVTIVSRAGAHRALSLTTALAAGGGVVTALAEAGCGSAAVCGLRAGDVVLAIAGDGACGLFRVPSVPAVPGQLALDPIVEPGAPAFPPGSVIVPVTVDVIAFDAREGALRRYDGYRSDSILVDGLTQAAFAFPQLPASALGDGPFTGTGPLAWDADQLEPGPIALRVSLAEAPQAGLPPGASFGWSSGPWP